MRKSQNKWVREQQLKKSLQFLISSKLTAPHALRITQFVRRTPGLYSSSGGMTTVGTAEQGVGLFLGFGKCLESQRGTDRNPKHHPGWGPDRRAAGCRKVIPSEWKLLSLLHSWMHTQRFLSPVMKSRVYAVDLCSVICLYLYLNDHLPLVLFFFHIYEFIY